MRYLSPMALAMAAACSAMPCATLAQSVADAATDELPELAVTATADEDIGFAVSKASSTTKSDARLLETPQSVSVVTRELLDSQQAKSLAEALRNVAGVVPGQYGRRGFDDFIIRGQRASESTYVDGLRTAQSVQIPEEMFGADRVEVLKGPASLLFGNVQPGGMVNIVSKRPRSEAFAEVGATVGSDGYRQATVDLGRPLGESERAAVRVNALAQDSDDPTDFVYFKTRYIAPSLSLDVGDNTDLTLITSYHAREWLRQQGLSPKGTILPNPNGPIPLNRFIGEPSIGGYDVDRTRIGYALEHRFASDWTLHQNFRWEDYGGVGPGVFNGTLQANGRSQNRTASVRVFDGNVWALDSYVAKEATVLGAVHHVAVGLDWSTQRERFAITNCSLPAIDLYNPTYGVTVTCSAAPNKDETTELPLLGLYLRDRIEFGERLDLSLGLRRDRAGTEVLNNKTGAKQTQRDEASTGSVGLTYEVRPGVAPYASYATSFLPVPGTDFAGAAFEPETGEQAEIGVKFELGRGRSTATLAAYDLKRQNVTTADPDHNGYSIQTGEQRSKGVEAELALDLDNGWNVTSAYAYSDSEVTKDTAAAKVGKPLDNMPQHSASTWGNYQFRNGGLHGLGLGLGARYESEKRGASFNYTVPDYTVVDAAVNYLGNGYRLALNVRNLFDKVYYAGGLNNNVVTLGDPRQLRLSAVVEF